MSENLDLVRSISTPWERGDFGSIDWAHPEIEYVIADGPAPGSWKGIAGMAQGWTEFLRAWDEFRVKAEGYRELDGEHVLVLAHFSARGRTSGLEVRQFTTTKGGANLFNLRGGQVTRLVVYWDRARAFADLGLAE